MKKYILIIVTIVLTSLTTFSQTKWDGKFPWYSADRYGDIRRGVALTGYQTECYILKEINNMNKFEEGIDTLLYLDDDILYGDYFFDFENKKISLISITSKTIIEYDILKIKKRNVNKEKTDGVFTLKVKTGKTKVNYYINTYENYFYRIEYSKKLRSGFVMRNKISGIDYKTDD